MGGRAVRFYITLMLLMTAQDIFIKIEDFCNLFVDLNKSCDYKYNAYGFLMELFREEM